MSTMHLYLRNFLRLIQKMLDFLGVSVKSCDINVSGAVLFDFQVAD